MRKEYPKKLYLVKREVIARNVREALTAKGSVYCIEIAEKESQPENKNNLIGFKCPKKKDLSNG